MNTLSLVLSIVGVTTCWPSGWGWIGVACGVGGCVLALRGFANPRTSPGDLGYNFWAFILGGWAMLWGTALQIKHSAGALDVLLLPVPFDTLAIAGAAAFAVFWASIFASRRVARVPLLMLAIISLLALFALGSSALMQADRNDLTPRWTETAASDPQERQ